MKYFDPNKESEVYVDASPKGLGGILDILDILLYMRVKLDLMLKHVSYK